MQSRITTCTKIAHARGYRVTAAGEVVSPWGRVLSLRRDKKTGYSRYGITLTRVQLEQYGGHRTMALPVHRLAAYQLFGEAALQHGIHTRHLNGDSCDNRLVNIAIGTQSDNEMDKPAHVRKAAAAKASQAARSSHKSRRKLTDDQVREVRKRYAAGEPTRSLAKMFAVHLGTVNGIVYGRAYKDVK